MSSVYNLKIGDLIKVIRSKQKDIINRIFKVKAVSIDGKEIWVDDLHSLTPPKYYCKTENVEIVQDFFKFEIFYDENI